jgi:DNA-binding CsgD family transcriptional regulator
VVWSVPSLEAPEGNCIMDESERLSALVGEIYDAALNASLWPRALDLSHKFVGGCAAAIFAKDASRRTGLIYHDDGGIEERFVRLYFERYIKIDPFTTPHYFAELDEPVATSDLIPYDEFLQSRFYKEWARPQNLVDHVTTAVDKAVTSVAMFGVFRNGDQGIADDEMRRRMRLVSPHIRRALLIGRLIDLKSAETAAFADTLDSISAGMFLVDATARIVHANAAGFAMIDAAIMLRAADDRLAAVDPAINRLLHDVIVASSAGDAAVGTSGIALGLRALDGERFVAHVLPLTTGARRLAGATYAAVAAIFVRRAALETPSPPEVIAKAYGLTPTELRILLAIVEVGGIPEVADTLGIGESTVKFHVRALFEKTGMHRQADLVKLVAGYTNPLVSPVPGTVSV